MMSKIRRVIHGSNIIRVEEGDRLDAVKVFVNDAYLGEFVEKEIEDFIQGLELLIKLYEFKPKWKNLGYFDRPEVSNSDLSDLALAIGAIDDYKKDMTEILNFGTLVDAMLTTPLTVSSLRMSVVDDRGEELFFSPEAWSLAVKMSERAKRDEVIKFFVDRSVGQKVITKTLPFHWEGSDYDILGRCKFDALAQKIKTGGDYKTTACKTPKAFKESINFFNWDRQAAFYMDLAEIDYHWILGLSKTTNQLFKFAIERGDEIHSRGVEKYSRLAYHWVTLIENFV